MRNLLIRTTTLLFRLYSAILYRRVSFKDSRFFASRVHVLEGNRVEVNGGWLHRSSVDVAGTGNSAFIGSVLEDSMVEIRGEGNVLTLKCRILKGVKLVIKGSNCRVLIGEDTTMWSGTIVCEGDGKEIVIGRDCMFSDNVDIWNSDTHPIYDEEGKLLNPPEDVRIGDHVWLCKNVAVLKGVTVGDGAVVGMGSVVTGPVSAGTLNVGTPSRKLREGIHWERENASESF